MLFSLLCEPPGLFLQKSNSLPVGQALTCPTGSRLDHFSNGLSLVLDNLFDADNPARGAINALNLGAHVVSGNNVLGRTSTTGTIKF